MHKNACFFRRFTALVLSLLMILQMMPVATLAEGLEDRDSFTSETYAGSEYAKVIFKSPGEEEGEYDLVASWNVEIGAALDALPEAPEIENYVFQGWMDGDTPVDEATIVTGDMELVAKYTSPVF